MAIRLETPKSVGRNVRPVAKASGTVITKDTIIENIVATGLVQPADSSTIVAEVAGVAVETIAAVDARTTVDIEETMENAEYKMAVTNNSDAAHNGQWMVLTDAGTVNNTGTHSATGIVAQIRPYGAAADKLIIGKFVKTA